MRTVHPSIIALLLLLGMTAVFPVTSPTASDDFSDYQLAVPGPNLLLNSTGRFASAKAVTDTFYIYGGPGTLEGQFQTLPGVPGGEPDEQGWTPTDKTEQTPHWRASTTNSSSTGDGNPEGFTGSVGNHSVISHHDDLDYVGYGNLWDDWLVFTYDVSAGAPGFDPGVDETAVRLTCEYKHFTEEAYDYLNFEWNQGGFYQALIAIDGNSYTDSTDRYEKRDFDSDTQGGISYLPGDYIEGTKIQIRIRVTSDGGWSDEDGLFTSGGRGAAAVDNITVYVNGVAVSVADWEPMVPKADLPEGEITGHDNGADSGTQGWLPTSSSFAGSFAKLFAYLEDLDECRDNHSYQWAFVNDGTPPNNCPGCSVDPSVSPVWNYGPDGYVVDYNGGLSNGAIPIHEAIVSPEIDWDLPGPEDDVANGGATLGFTIYEHTPLANGIFTAWSVRSYSPVDGWTGWEDRAFVYYSNSPRYVNRVFEVGDLLAPDRTKVQIELEVIDLAEIFAFPGADATPSPYYDNVYFKKYVIGGPSIVTRTIDLASDCFPVDGTKTGSCRFDANIDTGSAALVPGDSIVAELKAIIPGTQLLDDTVGGTMEVAHLVNPDFAGARAAALSAVGAVLHGSDPQSGWDIYTYSVPGQQVRNVQGTVISDRYFWDLPDGTSNGLPHITDEDPIFFPGDVIHYYLRSEDDQGNVTTLPDDIAGLTDFAEGTAYSRVQTVRGLPTLQAGDQPRILFWNDFGHRGGESEYLQAFRQNGMIEGVDYDTYTTKGPSSGVGNGLGSAGYHGANAGQLSDYDCMVYVLGNLSNISISDGTGSGSNDWSADLATMDAWANADADRFHVYFGDDFANSMVSQGAACQSYLNNVLGVDYLSHDLGPSIDQQTAATVIPSGLGSGAYVTSFVPYGGCLVINDFDVIAPLGVGPVMGHEFLDPTGNPYPDPVVGSVEWLHTDDNGRTKHSIVFPYDLLFIRDDLTGGGGTGISARAQLLGEVFASWGKSPGGPAIGTGDLPKKLTVSQNYPNPFNPSTTIKFAMPVRGHVTVKVFNVRGELVATLQDGVMEGGPQSVVWNGRDATGSSVSSGIYLYKVATNGTEIVKKMALLK